jgi:methylthioribose-1-phosphate isomerase
MKSILDYETVDYDKENNALVIIDQTKLPNDIVLLSLTTAQEIWDAIYLLKVRGAPAIGVAAAFGLAVLARQLTTTDSRIFLEQLEKQKEFLNSSRPTAVNLSWALERMMDVCKANLQGDVAALQDRLLEEAFRMKEEDIAVCRKIGEYGLQLLQPEDGILTHCNAGQLAACKYGTATAPLYLAQEKGWHLRVYADETRPLLQGARLTAFELCSAGMDVTLLCDNMSASLMQQGLIQAVFVGCDRVAANGDTANKIGTAVVAAVAKQYHVPFYVCAPTSTIDFATPTGKEIVIEQRNPKEVSEMWYQKPMTAPEVKIYNPAFDVTEHSLITGFITEKGIVNEPEELLTM